jgi:hypothetical protein
MMARVREVTTRPLCAGARAERWLQHYLAMPELLWRAGCTTATGCSVKNEPRAMSVKQAAKRRAKPPTKKQQLKVGLIAFFNLAARWELTIAEQCGLLAVSPSTRARWKVKPPAVSETLLQRLRLVILTYQRLVEVTGGGSDAETARVLRLAGSADNPKKPRRSLLAGLSTRSLPEMERCYLRLEGLIHAS